MANLDVLMKQRSGIKGRITRIHNFAQSFDETRNLSELSVRTSDLDDLFRQFNDVQLQIETFDENGDRSEINESERDSVETKYYFTKSLVDIKLKNQTPLSTDTGNRSNCCSVNRDHEPYTTVRLPPLNIPIFDGKLKDWPTFKNLFDSVIHNNFNLSTIQKFNYLKSVVKDEAASLIDSLIINEENYQRALDILTKRYDNITIVANFHLNTIYNWQVINKSNLREFMIKLEQSLDSLRSIKVPVEFWDLILVFIITQKLDNALRSAWELHTNCNELPSINGLMEFLNQRASAFERINEGQSNKKVTHLTTNSQVATISCINCKDNHFLFKCPKFLDMQVHERNKFCKSKKLCFNCLRLLKPNHNCSQMNCKSCNRRHHTLLHDNNFINSNGQKNTQLELNNVTGPPQVNNNQVYSMQTSWRPDHSSANNSAQNNTYQPTTMSVNNNKSQVLLSTAVVKIQNVSGQWCFARLLLDSASEVHLISKKLASRLNLKNTVNPTTIQGLSNSITNTQCSVSVKIQSRISNCNYKMQCLVVEQITVPLPHQYVNTEQLIVPSNYKLADPKFNVPGEVDILLGAQLFFEIMRTGHMKLGPHSLHLNKTVFGWIVSGSLNPDPVALNLVQVSLHTHVLSISEQLQQFWQIEEVTNKVILSAQDKLCEQIFENSVKRDKTGRYTVDLPLIEDKVQELGDSFPIAYKCLQALENRFSKCQTLYDEYKKFIDEYLELGHAHFVPLKNVEEKRYYLPHHAVLRPESTSTKLRVVFNASAQTLSGKSLNDVMLTGPKLQPDVVDVILRFRVFKYAFSADIVKMFRQININPAHQVFQCVLWRDSPEKQLKCLQLKTVTYGTKSAPYLAYRTLLQLAKDEGLNFPEAASCVSSQFYMDDVLTGKNTISEVINLREQLIQLLNKGGFILHKWATNHPKILINQTFNNDSVETTLNQGIVKILGLKWDPYKDTIATEIPKLQEYDKIPPTKRSVLSCIARIFDPIGLVGPVLITAKLFLQKLWKGSHDWDEPLTDDLLNLWTEICITLNDMPNLPIPRHYFNSTVPSKVELVGFCDSSLQAYGACVYIRGIYNNGSISSTLVISKSRVAPMKKVTIPRLELCGALLLARLIQKLKLLNSVIAIEQKYLFSDSTIVLSWLKNPPKNNIFVTNRVSEILELTPESSWSYTSTQDNPADYLTREFTPFSKLMDLSHWWHGPPWLVYPQSDWPKTDFKHTEVQPDVFSSTTLATTTVQPNEQLFIQLVFNKFSNFRTLKRVLAYCFRFIRNSTPNVERLSGPLNVPELIKSHNFIIKQIQNDRFPKEIREISRKMNPVEYNTIINTSPLKRLTPFIDKDSLLRVGGRIKHANIQFDQKHPIILPSNNHITTLIIEQLHVKLFHAGIQNSLTNLRLKYWPINGRAEVKRVIFKCITCTRFRAITASQLMADLPKDRVTFNRPFLNVGTDFGGPVYIKSSHLRKATLTKGYICLFVCLSTRAIHIELVTDLSTEAFLAALKRFISRRGICNIIHSDNATNFKGAFNELKKLHHMFKNQNEYNKIINFASDLNITWKFTVPCASHMGGLYEAGIKSVKTLLKKQLGNAHMTYEELYTVLVQIEAILNSRPLCPVSDLPDDLTCLTPAHFLIGESLQNIHEPDILCNKRINKISLWQRITLLKQQFWKQWSNQYLTELQQRSKWCTPKPNISVGDLVLIKEDATPPLSWPKARVLKVFVNKHDGLVRSALVKTEKGEFHRPVNKLILLMFKC